MDHPGILHRLDQVLQERKRRPRPDSYTCQLFQGGVEALGAKLQEETQEVLQAARAPASQRRDQLVYEAADVMYHLLALLAWAEVPWSLVEAELQRRFGTSGLAEKAARAKKTSSKPQ